MPLRLRFSPMRALRPALALAAAAVCLLASAQTASSAQADALAAGASSEAIAAAVAARSIQANSASSSGPQRAATVPPPGALPPDPRTRQVVFGSQIFSGRFASEAFSGFNPEYQLAVGDRVHLRLWGAFNFEGLQVVDAQGNLFIPSIGPVRVQGVRNAELNERVEAQVKRTFRANVGVYATLEAAQPVKIYVTGYVRAPGLYPGLSSDSVLYYLDRAGGIDPDRGSYLSVSVLRGGKLRTKVDLYRFLVAGQIDALQLQDGDTIVVAPRRHAVLIGGEVLNPYLFELGAPRVSAQALLDLAQPLPSATHLSIVRRSGPQRRSEYHPIEQAGQVMIEDGDELTLTSDKYPGTILVRIEGANLSERTLVLPYGSRLKEAMGRMRPAPQANMAAVQLFRRSVAERQKQLLDTSLRGLETYALTSRSATAEESALRARESQQLLEFIQRARQVQPRGQVVLSPTTAAADMLLEDGDTLRIPETSSLVLVSGEVMVPNALVYDRAGDLDSYIRAAGGYTQGADEARVLVFHQDGSVAEAGKTALQAGDEIMVLPKIQTKSIEVTRGITQIIYQIAVAAKIALGL